MSAVLVVLVAAIYMGVAAKEIAAEHYGLALMFFAYALANAGLLWEMQK